MASFHALKWQCYFGEDPEDGASLRSLLENMTSHAAGDRPDVGLTEKNFAEFLRCCEAELSTHPIFLKDENAKNVLRSVRDALRKSTLPFV